MKFPGKAFGPAAFVFVVATFIYLGTLRNGLIWDDNDLILRDPRIHSPRTWPSLFSTAFFIPRNVGREASYYRPVVSLSYGLDYMAAGGLKRVWVYHLHNMIVYGLCCVLVFCMLRRIAPPDSPAPMLVGLVFATHLMHSESVAWVSGRTDVYAGLLMAGAWLVYERATRRERPWARAGVWVAALLGLAAMMAKEVAIVLVALLALWEVVRRGGGRAALGQWRSMVPTALATALYLALRWHALRGLTTKLEQAHFDPATPAGVATVAWSVWVYLGKLVLPVWSSMGFEITPFASARGWVQAASIVGMLGLVAFGVLCLRRFPRTAFGLGWFGLTLLPALNIIPIAETAAERFLFVPSIGAAVVLAVLANFALASRGRAVRVMLCVSLALYSLAMAVSVVQRTGDWRSEETFCVSNVRTAPGDARSHLALGHVWERDRDWPRSVRLQYLHAIALKTTMAAAYNNLGKLEYRHGSPFIALSLYFTAKGLSAGDAIIRCNIAEALMSLALSGPDRKALWAMAYQELEQAIRTSPRSADAWLCRGRWHLFMKGHEARAADDFRRAAALDPPYAEAWYWLGAALTKMGRTEEAEAAFARARRLNPALAKPPAGP